MKRVMVVGLLKKQHRQIESTFPNVDGVENAGKLGLRWRQYDVVVLMTRFVSHNYNIDTNRCQVVYCTGSVTRLKSQLKEVLDG